MKLNNILVLGANGYLGKHLVTHLKQNPENVVDCADKDVVDLRDSSQCKIFFANKDYQEIYQLAANSGSIKYLLSKDYNYGDSTIINLSIIRALKAIEFKGRILFPSTFYAYNSTNKYGLEKLYNESLYLSSGLDVRIPRLFSIYGIGEILNSPQEKVSTAFCRRVVEQKSNEALLINGHPWVQRHFLYLDDAIKGLVEHMSSDTIFCDLGGVKAISLQELMDMILKVSGKDIEVNWTYEGEISNISPAQIKIDWEPNVSLEDGITVLYGWVKNELS